MKKVLQESWSWTLYEDAGVLYLSVMCGTVGLYSIDFPLTPAEALWFGEQGASFVAGLAGAVRYDPDRYRHRHVPGVAASSCSSDSARPEK